MEHVIFIEGNVNHPLTIDPSVWIFDDRKVDLNTYFQAEKESEDELVSYTKRMSAQFDKAMIEGSEPPKPEEMNKPLYKKEILLNGSFGMPIEPFINNSLPNENAKEVIVVTKDGEQFTYPFDVGKKFILGFSKDGKPLREDGPVHVYLDDGSNQHNPIKNVRKIVIK